MYNFISLPRLGSFSEVVSGMFTSSAQSQSSGEYYLDVYQKDGNSKEHKLSGGIGVISSKIMGEGPIKKKKKTLQTTVKTGF